MRGKQRHHHDCRTYLRIIPARAGQTTPTPNISARTTDHPRACGANLPEADAMASAFGSSPRVRGKRPARSQLTEGGRIIPARAGQTILVTATVNGFTDHPRACGANVCSFLSPVCSFGSSPRVRGKRIPEGEPADVYRIIPARAGQTPRRTGRSAWRSDHPRACGANPVRRDDGFRPFGSSPRVRGKPVEQCDGHAGFRIIPARAGQTY